jgi:NAD(P)-dependent dehydrogenase (short-subunit alcohol dehydrogenase family)
MDTQLLNPPLPLEEPLLLDQPLKDKLCLVTGGSRGIGLAIARMLLQEGARVALCGRNQNALDAAVADLNKISPGKVGGKVADVKDYEQVGALFAYVDEALGGLDVLVNNAGVGWFKNVSELTVEDWAAIIGTNLSGAFYCAREALRRFSLRGGGYIVNISSLAGKNAFAGAAAYNASKFGLNGFSEAVMLDSRYDNVRVSTIAPGSVATEFGGQASSTDRKPADWKVQPDDVAEIVRMLLRLPARTMASYVEVRPSKPPRK